MIGFTIWSIYLRCDLDRLSSCSLAEMSDRMQTMQQASTSPEDQWENWMDWNPTPKAPGDRRSTPPSESSATGCSERSSLETNRAPLSPPSSKTSDSGVQPSKKRKAFAENANSPSNTDGQPAPSVQNRSHSLVEKHYRNNLNEKIAELRDSVPSLRQDVHSPDGPAGSVSAPKFNKATILTKAIEHIKQLEKRTAQLEAENDALRHHAHCEAKEVLREESPPKEETSTEQDISLRSSSPKIEPPLSSPEAPGGIIPVPEDFRRLRDVEPQPHYADDIRFASRAEHMSSAKISMKGGRLLGKLMVGSFAGLMVMDRIAGGPEEDRGLFALPSFTLIRVAPCLQAALYHLASSHYRFLLLPVAKGVVIFCLLGLFLFLYLFNSKPKLGKTPTNVTGIDASRPSVSPMEFRRNAWLTSIQTVWVPRHSMLPEMWGLIIETHAYITRQLLGWRSYSWLTGRSEEEETARVRAWEIALDAQLTGGDTELSKGRLVLTLWAAGTLPKSPTRIMLKALHLRVMFWQASDSTWVCRTLDLAASHLARYQWKLAQRMLLDTESASASDNGELPDHLTALLKCPIEEVMTNSNIHRLHNLAWNRPTSLVDDGEVEIDGLIEDDTAMRGPLDILALWTSNSTLHRALQGFIESGETTQTCVTQVHLALCTAPPGSSSSVRALAATAVLSETDLVSNIAHLLQALPLVKPNSLPTSLADFDSLSKTIRNDMMTAIECVGALIMVMGVRQHSKVFTKAMQVMERSLSKTTTMGMLGFAATLRLLMAFSKDPSLARQYRSSITQLLRNAIVGIDKSCEQDKAYPGRQVDRKMALQRILALQDTKRRSSIDTGYGSMSDEEESA